MNWFAREGGVAPLGRDTGTRRDAGRVGSRPTTHRCAIAEYIRDGAEVALTAREFDLLTFMVMQKRTVFSREELLEHVWGFSYGDTSTVTVHIRRLREKIESDPSDPVLIKTVWGVGYRFDP